MSMIQRNRGIGRRNAPLATLLLALPIALLLRCTSTHDDNPSTGPSEVPEVPEVPVVECTTVDQCELPRSTCAGPSLNYYSNARCEAGHCAWDQNTMLCSGDCFSGGCASITMTAGGSPPFQPSCGGASDSNAGDCVGGAGGFGADDAAIACEADEDGGPEQCVP